MTTPKRNNEVRIQSAAEELEARELLSACPTPMPQSMAAPTAVQERAEAPKATPRARARTAAKSADAPQNAKRTRHNRQAKANRGTKNRRDADSLGRNRTPMKANRIASRKIVRLRETVNALRGEVKSLRQELRDAIGMTSSNGVATKADMPMTRRQATPKAAKQKRRRMVGKIGGGGTQMPTRTPKKQTPANPTGGNDRHDAGTGARHERGPVDQQQQSDVVLDWNKAFNEIAVANEKYQNPGYASRAMAMFNLAIYDATVAASGDGKTFYDYKDLGPVDNVQAQVAASEAAYTVLSSLYSDQQALIDSFRHDILKNAAGNYGDAASLQLGKTIGDGVLAARANDGSGEVVEYTYKTGNGKFQADPLNPNVPVWGPGWGNVDTFAIGAPEPFAPPTTPPLDSKQYAKSYNEVLELGSVDSKTRTADQTEAGIFWAYDRVGLGTPMSLYSDAVETIAIQQGNSFEENAALFAQSSVAMADAAVVAWQTKFGEEFWRPVTAIREGNMDGNPHTVGDADWTALGAPDGEGDIIGFTPQFPTYISGHATFGGAVFGSLQEFYGTDDIAFDLSSNELKILMDDPHLQEAYGLDLADATRSFDTLSEAMAENGRSRVYLGIHFDFDDTVGQDVGKAVASSVATKFVVPSGQVDDPIACDTTGDGTPDAGGKGHQHSYDVGWNCPPADYC